MNNQKVSLGFGTLILIALIVLIFANGPNQEMKKQLDRIEVQIKQVQRDIDSLKLSINELKTVTEKKTK